MYNYKLNKLPKKTYEIIITILKDQIAKEQDKAFETLRQELVVSGFRKGKVPQDMAKKHISEVAIKEQSIKGAFPKIYEEIVKKEGLRPIISPKIELIKANPQEDWQFKITIAEKPEVELGNYKELLTKVKGEIKKPEIWTPGKGKGPKDKKQTQDENNNQTLNKILSSLIDQVKVDVSDIITEEEVNQRLVRLIDDVQRLGLTLDTYLKSKNTTVEKLKEQFKKEAEEMYKLEFILDKIADTDNVTVEDKDLEQVFDNIKDPKEKEQARKNAYFYASLIRRQKTLAELLRL